MADLGRAQRFNIGGIDNTTMNFLFGPRVSCGMGIRPYFNAPVRRVRHSQHFRQCDHDGTPALVNPAPILPWPADHGAPRHRPTAFAMVAGGGPISGHQASFPPDRPGLLLDASRTPTQGDNNQNNLRYAGINFTFGRIAA